MCSRTTELFHRSEAPRPFTTSPSHWSKPFSLTRHMLPRVQLTPLDLGGFGPLASQAHLSEQLQMANGPEGRGMGCCKARAPLGRPWPGTFRCRDLSWQPCLLERPRHCLPAKLAGWCGWAGKGGLGACKSPERTASAPPACKVQERVSCHCHPEATTSRADRSRPCSCAGTQGPFRRLVAWLRDHLS